MLCIHAVSDEDGHPLEDEDESGMSLCNYWGKIFEARVEGDPHDCLEDHSRIRSEGSGREIT